MPRPIEVSAGSNGLPSGPPSGVGQLGVPTPTTATASARVRLAPRESATRTVTHCVPAAVGVPVIVPPLDRVRPAGRVPSVMLQVYGPVPPDAASAAEYAWPGRAVATTLVSIVGSTGPRPNTRVIRGDGPAKLPPCSMTTLPLPKAGCMP